MILQTLILCDIFLFQAQAIVVGFLAAVAAMVFGWIPEGKFDVQHGFLLCASSVVTASLASFVLGEWNSCARFYLAISKYPLITLQLGLLFSSIVVYLSPIVLLSMCQHQHTPQQHPRVMPG